MRIFALLTDAFGGQGGIAKFNRDLLTALCAIHETEKVIAWPRVGSHYVKNLPEKLSYRTKGMNNKFKYVLRVFSEARSERKATHLICGHINLLFLAWLLKKMKFAEKLILIVHGIEVWKRSGFLKEICLKDLDGVITVSDFTYRKFKEWAPIEGIFHFVLPNSIDLEKFSIGEKDEKLKQRYGLQDQKVILTVARLNAQERYKGVDEMLGVLSDLKKEKLNFVYLIVGGGDDQKRLEKKAKELDLDEEVIFAGYIPEEEKVAHYQLADLFAMPGRGEGFGIVYLEALACGIPVIGSKVDGSREALMEGKLGLLVDPDKLEELENKILWTIRKEKKEVPILLNYYSFDRYKERVREIINEIMVRK